VATAIRFVVGAVLAVLLSALFSVDVHAQTPHEGCAAGGGFDGIGC
jgi:hypothetical protein